MTLRRGNEVEVGVRSGRACMMIGGIVRTGGVVVERIGELGVGRIEIDTTSDIEIEEGVIGMIIIARDDYKRSTHSKAGVLGA